jgi:hypothetical protein
MGAAAGSAGGVAANAGQAAAQVVFQQQQQQQQQQQLVKGLQDTVKVLSGQLLLVLSELHKLAEQSVQNRRCDVNSDDPHTNCRSVQCVPLSVEHGNWPLRS